MHPIRERLGILRGGFDAFRHGLGTALMQAGSDARVCAATLGHADLRMLAPVRTRRSARPKSSGRTHNGFVFVAICGELGRQVVEDKLGDASPTGFEPVLPP